MSREGLVIKARFRARGYSDEDRRELGRELSEIGPNRLRALYIPEAGGSYELWLAVEFVGTSLASGLLGHVAGRFYDNLSERLRRFFASKRARDAEPEMDLTVSYDDVDIVFTQFNSTDLPALPSMARDIHDAVTTGPLAGKEVTRIVVGMAREDDAGRWYEPSAGNGLIPDRRFWGIAFASTRDVSHIFDTRTRLVGENPRG
jgi:hypothetical protein